MTPIEELTYDSWEKLGQGPDGSRVLTHLEDRTRNLDAAVLVPRMWRFVDPEEIRETILRKVKPEGVVYLIDGDREETLSIEELRSFVDDEVLGTILRQADERHRQNQSGDFIGLMLTAVDEAKKARGLATTRTELAKASVVPIDTLSAA